MRILLVKDDQRLRPEVKQRLEAQRYAVDPLTDGADALQAALVMSYDVLIVDVMLPTLNRFALCRKLR